MEFKRSRLLKANHPKVIPQKSHFLLIVSFILVLELANSTTCDRQRCCLLDPCTNDYCTQKNSQSWVSTQNFANYQYTKLVLANNECMPCSYDCKTCSSETQCTECAEGFYLDSTTSTCQLCSDKCLSCTVVNSITKCSSCETGTYLDSTTLECKSCPTGASSCSSSTAIIECSSGYKKSSNSLYCTSCPTNCASCPFSDTICSSCSTGYYLSSNTCLQCSVSNCDACLAIGVTVYCTSCSTGYLLQAGTCAACPSNCDTCTSTTVCTTCSSGYYVVGGACSAVSATVENCQTYSSSSECSSCSSGYYLQNSMCYPCSILCATCDGPHFGSCLSCHSNAKLFNKMCLIENFPSSETYNKYFSFPHSSSLLSSGSMSCGDDFLSGSSISINLNDLEGSKLEVSWHLYSASGSTTYSVTLGNSAESGNTSYSYTTSSTQKFSSICSTSTGTEYHLGIENTQNFSSIKTANTLTFSTDNGVEVSLLEVSVTVHRCNSLCIQCSDTQCTQCMLTSLYTQDAYCVYSCSNGYYIYQDSNSTTNPNQCVSECPLGSYAQSSNVSCVTCVSPCLTCLNDVFCLSCVEGYYLTKENLCETTCPYKYYGKVETQTCEQCVGRCLECTSEEVCLSCVVGFLYNTTSACIDDCSQSTTGVAGLYADLSTLYCESCHSDCLNCEYSSTRCTQCSSTTFFYENACLSACPDGYYAPSGSNVCTGCDYPCKNCATTSTNCTSCQEGYLSNNTCATDCPSGTFEDNTNLQCSACDSKCTECLGSSTNCLSCQASYYYYNYQCYATCPDEFYAQNISSVGVCSACVGLCKTCLNQSYCLSCESNFLDANGDCISSSSCPDGQFADIQTLSCQPCSSPCVNCQYNSSYCTSCDVNNADGLKYLESGQCVASCSSTYYYPSSNDTWASCEPCQQPCLTCTTASSCLSCISGYKFSNTVCSSTCSVGTFFDSSISDCTNCSSNCQVCNSAIFCQSCSSSYFISSISTTENQCISTCPSQYYGESLSSSCQSCIYPCDTCESSIDCLSCLTGVLYEKRCISTCPDSTYLDTTTNECITCAGNCLTCSSDPQYCESCQDGFYLYYVDNTCISSCPSNLYAEELTKSCLQCPSTCAECTNSTHCTACIANSTYNSSSSDICVEYCPSGFYGNGNTTNCEACDSKCLTCQTNSSNCLSCVNGYYFVKLSYTENDCQTSCPSGYYAESAYCYECIFPCESCSSPTQCLSCVSGTFLHSSSSSCLLSCPVDTFYDYDNYECTSCSSPCQSCSNNATYCLSCLNSTSAGTLYLYDGTCISECPTGYYADDSGICNRCYGLCDTCSAKYYCLTCLAGFVYDGYCYSSCPLGTYADTNTSTCIACDSTCSECILQANYCTKCSGGLYVYKGECSSACPTGTYEDNSQCYSCTFPCIECSSQQTCTDCLGGYLRYMNLSCIDEVETCPNDFYKMDAKVCVPVTWCPSTYYIDETDKTCSSSCDRTKYTHPSTQRCLDSCESGEYVGVDMVCYDWTTNPPISLMGMSAITYIQSSYLYIEIVFNETQQWSDVETSMYTFSYVTSRRMLYSQSALPEYSVAVATPEVMKLKIPSSGSYPERVSINLPAYRVKSSSTQYPLQNPDLTLNIPEFTAYTDSQIYSGIIMGQFSEGISWFILLLSFFFLFKNRLSDLYVLWDTVQLLYLLIFLNIQYPPNLNEFFRGLEFTHLYFLPSLFTVEDKRNISDSPFYSYSHDNSFLRNTGHIFTLLVVVFGILAILKLLETLIRNVESIKQKAKEYPNIKGFIYKGILRYRWHHTSDVLFTSYAILMLFAFAQINFMSQNEENEFSNALAILSCIGLMLWTTFVGYKLYRHYSNISKGKMVNNLKCFYRGIQRDNKFGVSLVLIRYARKLFYSLVIAVFSMDPMYALPMLMFSSVLMALFLAINTPYKKRLSNIITVGSEVIMALMYLFLALINFEQFGASLKQSFGWVCCLLLAFMIFALIYEIFCKTMFYLEPQEAAGDKNKQKAMMNGNQEDDGEAYLRRKAQEFFDSLLPKLRDRLNLDDDSDEELCNYEDGDSDNSQNNERRERGWDESQNSDEFKHYDNSSNSEDPTQMKSDLKIRAPQYLVRCVKDID